MEGHADDALLANLYWNMKLLCSGLPAEAVEWRFMWRWLKAWGLAPEISEYTAAAASELSLLHFVSVAKTLELESLELQEVLKSKRRLFADASRRAEMFLRET